MPPVRGRAAKKVCASLMIPQNQPMVKNNLLEAALDYVRRGWAVIPLAPKSKVPYSPLLPKNAEGKPSWKLLKDKPADEELIRYWYEIEPNLNIGIITGWQSGGLVVIDIDKGAQKIAVPQTPIVWTNRGLHIYTVSKTPVKSSDFISGTAKGEIRGENHYVVAPPSIHPSGIEYRWADFMDPDTLPLADFHESIKRTKIKVTKKKTPKPPVKVAITETEPLTPSQRIKGMSLSNKYTYILGTPYPKPYELDEWAKREDVAAAIMQACGVEGPITVGKAFLCPIHPETKPSAGIYREKDGKLLFHDFHNKKTYTPIAVYVAKRTGAELRKLKKSEQAIWFLRFLVEQQYIKAPRILAATLPPDTPAYIKTVYKGFVQLLSLRKLYNPDQPETAPYTRSFVRQWTGLTERQCKTALAWLFANGYLVKVQKGEFKPGGKGRATIVGLGKKR